jgi:hypothetical protein
MIVSVRYTALAFWPTASKCLRRLWKNISFVFFVFFIVPFGVGVVDIIIAIVVVFVVLIRQAAIGSNTVVHGLVLFVLGVALGVVVAGGDRGFVRRIDHSFSSFDWSFESSKPISLAKRGG